jgi:hypothetical protein
MTIIPRQIPPVPVAPGIVFAFEDANGGDMARVVIVHGIGQQYLGPSTLKGSLASAVADGVKIATGKRLIEASDVDVAFYGNWFRPSGAKGEDYLSAEDITDGYEIELLIEIWAAAADREVDRVEPPDPRGMKVPVPVSAQRALDALSRSRQLAGLAEQFLLGNLRQVRRYFCERGLRAAVQEQIAELITEETRVIIGHSLGSVVAYEAICAHPMWPVQSLITLGSPIGIKNLIYDRLVPRPVDGRGLWPGNVKSWTNISDVYDVVALVKQLAPLFPAENRKIRDRSINNGWKAHQIARYLTAAETGSAVSDALVVE